MEVYFLKNGTSVKIGDIIMKEEMIEHPIVGTTVVKVEIPVTPVNIPTLIKEGILFKEEARDSSIVPMELDYYINKIAKRMNWHPEKVVNYLNNTANLFPMASLSIMLREIAIELDKQYEDHIENSPEIYVISTFDGRIHKANKASIKNYKNFAAFRSVEDAKTACRITKDILKELFSGK